MAIIRASEVAEYVYCARAWWLRRVVGLKPAGQKHREAGMALHKRHGLSVWASSLLLLVAGIVFLVALGMLFAR